MKSQQMHDLKCIFGVRLVERPGLYLGANLDFSSRKGSLFSRILDRVGSKLSLWKAPLLAFLSLSYSGQACFDVYSLLSVVDFSSTGLFS